MDQTTQALREGNEPASADLERVHCDEQADAYGGTKQRCAE
jgi:hypothetical protein